MSIFNNTNNYNSTTSVPVIEGYGADVGGILTAVTESYTDQLAIMEAIHAADSVESRAIMEASAYSEGDTAYTNIMESYTPVYEAAIGNVFEKIKTFFQKLWTKVKSFFHALRRRFDLIFKDALTFVNKYENDLKKLKLGDMKATTFEYSLDHDPSSVVKTVDDVINTNLTFVSTTTKGGSRAYDGDDAIEAHRKKLDDAIEDVKSQARSKISGSSTSDMTEAEYNGSLFSLFRNGAKGPEDKKESSVNITNIISEIKGSKSLLTKIDEAATAANKRYASLVTETDKIAKSMRDQDKTKSSSHDLGNGNKALVAKGSGDKAASLLQKISTLTGLIQGIESRFYAAWKTAVEERNTEYKSIIGKALRYKEPKN